MTTQRKFIDVFAGPAAMTSADRHAPVLDELPGGVGELVLLLGDQSKKQRINGSWNLFSF